MILTLEQVDVASKLAAACGHRWGGTVRKAVDTAPPSLENPRTLELLNRDGRVVWTLPADAVTAEEIQRHVHTTTPPPAFGPDWGIDAPEVEADWQGNPMLSHVSGKDGVAWEIYADGGVGLTVGVTEGEIFWVYLRDGGVEFFQKLELGEGVLEARHIRIAKELLYTSFPKEIVDNLLGVLEGENLLTN